MGFLDCAVVLGRIGNISSDQSFRISEGFSQRPQWVWVLEGYGIINQNCLGTGFNRFVNDNPIDCFLQFGNAIFFRWNSIFFHFRFGTSVLNIRWSTVFFDCWDDVASNLATRSTSGGNECVVKVENFGFGDCLDFVGLKLVPTEVVLIRNNFIPKKKPRLVDKTYCCMLLLAI